MAEILLERDNLIIIPSMLQASTMQSCVHILVFPQKFYPCAWAEDPPPLLLMLLNNLLTPLKPPLAQHRHKTRVHTCCSQIKGSTLVNCRPSLGWAA